MKKAKKAALPKKGKVAVAKPKAAKAKKKAC